jgi:NAD(P)-dependent dehydrogenase (short-subunit alcohol dehydrogenase family)
VKSVLPIALIAGSKGAIGQAVAAKLVNNRLLLIDRDEQGSDANRQNDLIRRYKIDVTDTKTVAAVVQATENEWGPISSVVNLFGFHQVCEFENISDEAWSAMFDVHVNGTVNVCRATIPYMQRRGHGAIVNMSSSHLSPHARLATHYVSAKYAIIGLTKALAREKGPFGIRINAVAPGPVDSPMWHGSRHGEQIEATKAERSKLIPLRRIASVDDVANTIEFLLRRESEFITGHIIPIDGGESI